MSSLDFAQSYLTCKNDTCNSLLCYGSGTSIFFRPAYTGSQVNLICTSPATETSVTIPDFSSLSTNVNMAFNLNPVQLGLATVSVPISGSGGIISLQSAASASTYSLPAPSSKGLRYKFVVSGALSSAVTLASSGANVSGIAISADATAVGGTGFTAGVTASKTNIILSNSSAVGDSVEFISDGTKYLVNIFVAVHTTVTSS